MPLAGQNQDAIIAALNRAAGHLRGRLGRSVHLKFTPSLKFVADESFDEATRILNLLRDDKVAQDLANAQDPPDDGA
jgi:ribosome-binding factor A